MTDWREEAHHFRGFKVLHGKHEFTIDMAGKNVFFPSECGMTIPYKECKLIARPISDLSYEEVISFHLGVHLNEKGIERAKSRLHEINDLSPSVFLKLIEYRVYPFNNDNPKDIIWRYQND